MSRIHFKVPDYRGDYIHLTYLANDNTARGYDASGNAVSGWKRGWQTDYRKEESRSYYGAGDRLAAVRSYVEIQPTPWMSNRRGSLVEYRYDALGRRILVRTTRDGVCVGGGTDVDCTSGIERFVYAGDNVLWEMRGPGSSSSTPADLDQAIGSGQEYGAIGYTHAGGVDRPLAAYKLGVNAAVIAPHTNWRSQFSGGTYLQGGATTAPVSWPGYSTTAWHQGKPPQEQNRVYMGTLLEGQRDASGQMYMRNRMYDPATGQFTQTDPIGIAGGLNTYGFAAGDPVSYSDPYGLSPSDCISNPTLACRIGHAITRFLVGPPPDPDDHSGAIASPGMADPVAAVSGAVATRMVAGRTLGNAGAARLFGGAGRVDVGELVATHGPRLSRRQFDRLTADIAENGIQEPIKYAVYNGRKYVVDGHHRLMAAQRLGMEQVPAEQVTLPFRGYETVQDLIHFEP